MKKNDSNVLFGVLNDRFVAGFTGVVPAHLPWSHFRS